MTLWELYLANDNWRVKSTLVIVDEDLTIIEAGIDADLAVCLYGEREVFRFKGNSVMLKKEGNSNE